MYIRWWNERGPGPEPWDPPFSHITGVLEFNST